MNRAVGESSRLPPLETPATGVDREAWTAWVRGLRGPPRRQKEPSPPASTVISQETHVRLLLASASIQTPPDFRS